MEVIDEIVLATTNRGKLNELEEMLGGLAVKVRGLEEFGPIEEAEETGATFAQNARQKALHYSNLLQRCVLADDSGLQVEALDQAPGVYSARFAGVDGAERDKANNKKLLELLNEVPDEKRVARFCCCLCMCGNSQEVLVEVEGFLKGIIATEPRGNNGFGYDPIFYLPDKGKTVAELADKEKNIISHRGQALGKLLLQLKPMLDEK
ncbi:MAG: XTP/dITP diphosphatase [Sedimentisphaerales bacterium]|nr:XTP/dITP diphosphatase [Sedimentisphaerales bacterium]